MSCPVSTKTTTCPPPVPTESPRIQQRTVWKRLHEYHSARTSSFSSDSVKSERLWPTYDQVAAHIAEADYNHTLTCPMDLLPLNNMNDQGKIICPHAAMCCISMELFPCPEGEKPYTGLLTPAKNIEHGIIRLSSAMKPPGEMKSYFARTLLRASGEKLRKSRLFPCAALKFFREGSSSGNLLFGGSKIGQRESNYFAHCMCTSMTEQMPALVKPFVRKFWTYSRFPLSLGVSEFCATDADGEQVEVSTINFPFALVLKPSAYLQGLTGQDEKIDAESSFDNFLDSVLNLPSGAVLFDLFACADPKDSPDPTKLQRIGRITSTSPMLPSNPNDGIFFKHQKKEDDYKLRPDWTKALQTKVSIDNGKTTGTVGSLAGWKFFEQQIAQGCYIDYENEV